MQEPVLIQREYYRATADKYDDLHVSDADEHGFALAFMMGIIGHLGIRSVLDIGSGTGRALVRIKQEKPDVRIVGIEPSPELRERGQSKGLLPYELKDGDAQQLKFENRSFDLVCEFGALHHIPNPHKAVREMLRCARKAVFISDINNFGQGSPLARFVKQAINSLGLWPVADFIKTRGKRYAISEGDGLAYSYSVFNDYELIRTQCKKVHFLNTVSATPNLYRSASHVALLGILDER